MFEKGKSARSKDFSSDQGVGAQRAAVRGAKNDTDMAEKLPDIARVAFCNTPKKLKKKV